MVLATNIRFLAGAEIYSRFHKSAESDY